MDREANGPVIVASPEGGVDIEEVAEKDPSKILKVWLFKLQVDLLLDYCSVKCMSFLLSFSIDFSLLNCLLISVNQF